MGNLALGKLRAACWWSSRRNMMLTQFVRYYSLSANNVSLFCQLWLCFANTDMYDTR